MLRKGRRKIHVFVRVLGSWSPGWAGQCVGPGPAHTHRHIPPPTYTHLHTRTSRTMLRGGGVRPRADNGTAVQAAYRCARQPLLRALRMLPPPPPPLAAPQPFLFLERQPFSTMDQPGCGRRLTLPACSIGEAFSWPFVVHTPGHTCLQGRA